MKWEWVEQLLGPPLEFCESWLRASNGGLWELCQMALNGDEEAESNLQKLHELLQRQEQEFIERLQWFLQKQNFPTNLAAQLLHTIAQMVNDFLRHSGGDWVTFLDEEGEETEDGIPKVELQGLGIQQDAGFAIRLILELRDSPDKGYHIKPHPSCCLIPQDHNFQSAIENVKEWWVAKSDFANFPAQINWRIIRIDGQPISALKGDSLGGLFAVGIWHLLKSVPVDPTVSISAAISHNGCLLPVAGLLQKLHAAYHCIPPLRVLIVSSAQDLKSIAQIQSVSIHPAASLDEALNFFVSQNKEFVRAREKIKTLSECFRIFDKTLDWCYYQEPTLTIISEGRSLPLSNWLRMWLRGEERHWLLVAPSGMGKTTALKFITYSIVTTASWDHLLPIYMRADEWSNSRESLPEFLEDFHRFPLAPSKEQWQKWAELGRLVLLIDQLERGASNLDFLDRIRITIAEYPNIYLLMATRSEQQSSFRSFDLPVIQLEPLSERQAQTLSQKLGKPLPTIPLNEISPFLLIALLHIDHPIPQGKGELYLRLLEVLLEGNLPLPRSRIVEILSEAVFSHGDKDQWREEEFYSSLREQTAPQIADQIWVSIKDKLITRTDGFYSFVHTLLLESLRAYAVARKWQSNISASNIHRFLTPLRAILVASLLDPKVLPEFWNLLRRRMESEPREWAKAVAQCLNERPDYPQQIPTLLLARWFEAFRNGDNEKDGWDEAIKALPNSAIENLVFSDVQQKLTSRPLSERRAAAHLLALVAHKVKIPSPLVELLAEAFVGEYGFALLSEIKELFSHPLQHEPLCQFVSTIAKSLDSPLTSQRLRAIEAIERLTEASIMPENLKAKITNHLKKIVLSDESPKVRSVAQRALVRL